MGVCPKFSELQTQDAKSDRSRAGNTYFTPEITGKKTLKIISLIFRSRIFYWPPRSTREGNVLTRVCLSTPRGGPQQVQPGGGYPTSGTPHQTWSGGGGTLLGAGTPPWVTHYLTRRGWQPLALTQEDFLVFLVFRKWTKFDRLENVSFAQKINYNWILKKIKERNEKILNFKNMILILEVWRWNYVWKYECGSSVPHRNLFHHKPIVFYSLQLTSLHCFVLVHE